MPVGGNFTNCNCGPDTSACESPTQPVSAVGLCLSDGSPIAVTVVRDCAGTITSEGWINLSTGAWSAGAPPAGTIACGDSRSITTNGTFCDVLEDSTVVGLVLVEYQYAADGSIAAVRLVDAVTGETYTPQGEVTTCPAGVQQPDLDLVQLCDTAEDGTVVEFVRDYRRDENGQISGHTDYDLDGAPYAPAGTVARCSKPCRNCETLPLCDVPAAAFPAPVLSASTTTRTGTAANGVAWTVNGNRNGQDPEDWWSLALFPAPVNGPLTVAFDQAVRAAWGAQVGQRIVSGTTLLGSLVMPAGTVAEEIHPAHSWDPATRTLTALPDADISDPEQVSRFSHPGPETALSFTGGGGNLAATLRRVGAFEITPVPMPFLRTVCRDCEGTAVSTTDTLLDGQTAYTTSGDVAMCTGSSDGSEPCRDSSTLLLCDVAEAGGAEFRSNPDNATAGVNPDWEWSPSLAGPWYPTYDVAPNPAWTVTDTDTAAPAHWVSPHQNRSVCSPDPATAPNVTADWYAHAAWTLPADVDPESIRISASVLNADNWVVEWRLNDGPWQPVDPPGALAPPAQTFGPTQVPGARPGENEITVHVVETQPGVSCPSPNEAGILLHVTATGYTTTQFLRTVVTDCETGETVSIVDTTLDGEPYAVTGRVGQCTMAGRGEEPCRDSSTLIVCDLPGEGAEGTAAATDTDATAYPWDDDPIRCVTPHPGGGGALWTGGEVTIPPRTSVVGTCAPNQVLVGVAASLQADRPSCDSGTVTVTVSMDARNNGPSASAANYAGSLRLHRMDTGERLSASGVQLGSMLVGETRTMTVTASVDAALLADGQLAAIADVEAYDQAGNRGAGWTLANFTPSYAYAQDGCETQFLRTVVTDCKSGAVVSVADTTMDGAPYLPVGTVGVCHPPQADTEPCRDTSTILLCDGAQDEETGDQGVFVTDTDPSPYFAPASPGNLPLAGGQALWDGGSVVYGPDPVIPGSIWTHRWAAATIQADEIGCTDGTAQVTAAVHIRLDGPARGQGTAGAFQLLNTATGGVIAAVRPADTPSVGYARTLTISGRVPAADLEAGQIVVALQLETNQDGAKAWTASNFTADVVFGEGVCGSQFLRKITTDCETGETMSVVDTTLDGQPYEVVGEVGQCQATGGSTSDCTSCETLTMCDVQTDESPGGPDIAFEAIDLAALADGPTSGTLANGVGWTVSCGQWLAPQGHYTIYPVGSGGSPACDMVWTFDQPVYARIGLRGFNVGPGECLSWSSDTGAEFVVESLNPAHEISSTPNTICGLGTATDESVIVSSAPVSEVTLAAINNPGQGRGVGLMEVGLLTEPPAGSSVVPFLRTVCRDCAGTVTGVTDTLPDGSTAYTPAGTVGVCGVAGDEPCRDSTTLMLCDAEATATVVTPAVADTTVPPMSASSVPLAPPYTSLWDGGTLAFPQDPDDSAGDDGQVYRYATGQITASPANCAGAAGTLTVSVRVALGGPTPGVDTSGRLYLLRGAAPVAFQTVLNNAPVGHVQTLTVTTPVTADDLSSGALTVLLSLETFQGGPKSWVADQFTVSAELDGCAAQFLRTVTTDCETGEVVATTDTTLDGDPYTVTGEVGQCTATSPSTPPGPDTEVLTLCDVAEDGGSVAFLRVLSFAADGTVIVSDTDLDGVTPYTTAGTVTVCQQGEDGRDVELLAMCVLDNATGVPIQRVLAEVSYDSATGERTGVTYVDPQTWGPVSLPGGTHIGLCPDAEQPEPAPDVEVVQLCDLVDGAAPVPFLRHLVYTPGAVTPTVVDSSLDGVTPYVVAGTVGTCSPERELCEAQSVLKECRYDDTDGDGVADTAYVELIGVSCDGILTPLGTYTEDLSEPYTPTSPVGPDAGGDATPATLVVPHRVELAAGESWDASTVPLLQSVTATAHGGSGQLTTGDGASTLFEGESVSWSVIGDEDAALTGPLTVTAGPGVVTVSYTRTTTS